MDTTIGTSLLCKRKISLRTYNKNLCCHGTVVGAIIL